MIIGIVILTRPDIVNIIKGLITGVDIAPLIAIMTIADTMATTVTNTMTVVITRAVMVVITAIMINGTKRGNLESNSATNLS
jgi:hypothetical protein